MTAAERAPARPETEVALVRISSQRSGPAARRAPEGPLEAYRFDPPLSFAPKRTPNVMSAYTAGITGLSPGICS